ncbi:MAG: hypothetical protein ACRYG4_07360 [Janthinobacterium lividum]
MAFTPRRVVWPAIGLAAIGAVFVALSPMPKTWTGAVFVVCWATTIVAAASVHLPRGLSERLALLLALTCGLVAGATIAVAGTRLDLARGLPVALLAWPARWMISHKGSIAIKVVASWLVAVAILVGTLPIVPTPGYVADHME